MTQTLNNGVLPGSTITAYASIFTPDQTVNSGASTVDWALLADTGVTLASGTGTLDSYAVTPAGTLKVNVSADVTIPNTVPANVTGVAYALVFSVGLSDGSAVTQLQHQEAVSVVTPGFTALGPQAAIEIYGGAASLSLLLPQEVVEIGYEMYSGNTLLVPYTSLTPAPVATADGHSYVFPFDTTTLPAAALEPYSVFWSYKYSVGQAPQREMGTLYAITPRVYAAATQLQQMIQRAVVSLDQTTDTVFKPEDLLHWLVVGRAHFNGFAHPTNFSMVNASDVVMYYWTAFAAINALRSQALVEAMKAFDYQGASSSLTVDHAPAFNDMASALESQIQENCRQFKMLLSKRGTVAGDGNVNGLALSRGAIGSVGIALTPVSGVRNLNSGNSWMGVNRIF